MSELRVLIRHVLPNRWAQALVLIDHGLRQRDHHHRGAQLLGIGRGAADARVGAMVAEGRELITQWWISTFRALPSPGRVGLQLPR